MSAASSDLFSPVVRPQRFTDHSVAFILASESTAEQRPVSSSANLLPSGCERRRRELFVNCSTKPPDPLFSHLLPLRFNDFSDGLIARSKADVCRQTESFSSLSVFPDVDQLAAFRSGHHLDQSPMNFEEDLSVSDMQRLAEVVRMQETCRRVMLENDAVDRYESQYRKGSLAVTCFDELTRRDRKNDGVTNSQSDESSRDECHAGFRITSATNGREDEVEGGDGGGLVRRPTPMYPRPSTALPLGALSVSPELELQSGDLWRQFDQFTTEMVITKSGRFVYEWVCTER